MIIYVALHANKTPFKYKRLNVMETICLILLTSIIVTEDVIETYILLCVLIPLIIWLFYCIKTILLIYNYSKPSKNNLSQKDLNKIEIILNKRMPNQYKHLFKNINVSNNNTPNTFLALTSSSFANSLNSLNTDINTKNYDGDDSINEVDIITTVKVQSFDQMIE